MESSKLSKRTAMFALTSALITAVIASPAVAQSYPERTVRLVVGFAPGGGTDTIARMVAAGLSEKLKQQVVVENKTGANGNLATAEVAKAKPDGYTLLLSSGAQIVVSPNTYANMPADPVKGLLHIMAVGEGDFFVAASPQSGIKDAADLIKKAKERPGELKYGTSGAGGNLHLLMELVKLNAGINLTAVHYRGAGAMMPELLAGQLQVAADGGASMGPQIKAGALVPLFKTGRQRTDLLPDMPTSTEVGIEGVEDIRNWFGLHAPLETPPELVAKLREVTREVVNEPAFVKKMFDTGLAPVDDSPESFTKRIVDEAETYRIVVSKAKIAIE